MSNRPADRVCPGRVSEGRHSTLLGFARNRVSLFPFPASSNFMVRITWSATADLPRPPGQNGAAENERMGQGSAPGTSRIAGAPRQVNDRPGCDPARPRAGPPAVWRPPSDGGDVCRSGPLRAGQLEAVLLPSAFLRGSGAAAAGALPPPRGFCRLGGVGSIVFRGAGRSSRVSSIFAGGCPALSVSAASERLRPFRRLRSFPVSGRGSFAAVSSGAWPLEDVDDQAVRPVRRSLQRKDLPARGLVEERSHPRPSPPCPA